MPRDVTGLEYAAGCRAPVDGQQDYVTVVDSSGYNYEYKPASETLAVDVDATYAGTLLGFIEGVSMKVNNDTLEHVKRVRDFYVEDYFLSGISSPVTGQVGTSRMTHQGVSPTVTYSDDPDAPGHVLTSSGQFAFTLGPAYTTPLLDSTTFDKLSFIHKCDGVFAIGAADGNLVTGSHTNGMYFTAVGVGTEITAFFRSPGGGIEAFPTGVLQSAGPQAFRITRNGSTIVFEIDGVQVHSGTVTHSARMNPQMNYTTPGGSYSVVPMYTSWAQTLTGPALLDGNLD